MVLVWKHFLYLRHEIFARFNKFLDRAKGIYFWAADVYTSVPVSVLVTQGTSLYVIVALATRPSSCSTMRGQFLRKNDYAIALVYPNLARVTFLLELSMFQNEAQNDNFNNCHTYK